jgi:hypothetical protein
VLILLDDVPFTLTSSTVDAAIISDLDSFNPISSIELRDPASRQLLLASWLNTRGTAIELAEIELGYEPGSQCRMECGKYRQYRLRASSGSEEVVLAPGESAVVLGRRVSHGFSSTYEEQPQRCTDQTGRFGGYVVPEP